MLQLIKILTIKIEIANNAVQVVDLCGDYTSSVFKIESDSGVILTGGDQSNLANTNNCTRNFEYPNDAHLLVYELAISLPLEQE